MSIAKTVGMASFRIVDVLFAEKSTFEAVAPSMTIAGVYHA